MENRKKVELLAPAGDLERLKIAVAYGADAVYIGGKSFGLRAKAKNFDIPDMEEGIRFAHEHGVKVYVTANIFAHNKDLEPMKEYLKTLEEIGADAFIISDPGVFMLAKEVAPDTEIHVSTQANNTNYQSAIFWCNLGARRIVVARELSLDEIREIRSKIPEDMEIEAFIHGAMCISYSGRCLLSNYLTQRDSNQGDCAQPCRWKYHLVEETRPDTYLPIEENDRGTFIFNSKDMNLIGHIPELIEVGISSFKIEGRMKTHNYVAALVKAYRQAIDDYYEDPELYKRNIGKYYAETEKVSHRIYSTGFYFGNPDSEGQIYENSSYKRDYDFIAIVHKDYNPETGRAVIMQKNKFCVGDEIEVLSAKGEVFTMTVTKLINQNGENVSSAPHPHEILEMEFPRPVHEMDILRKVSDKN